MTISQKYNNLRKQTSSTWNRGATRCASLCPDKPPSVRPVANVARVAAAHRIFQDDVRHREPSEVLVAAFLDHFEAASHGRLFVRSSVQVLHHFLLPVCNPAQTSHMDLEWNHHATRGLGALRGLHVNRALYRWWLWGSAFGHQLTRHLKLLWSAAPPLSPATRPPVYEVDPHGVGDVRCFAGQERVLRWQHQRVELFDHRQRESQVRAGIVCTRGRFCD